MMIYLIGTHHKYQVAGTAPNVEFLAYLVETLTKLEATVVAEEMNTDGETVVGGPNGKSIAAIVAERLAIRHVFCDPDKVERKELGIKSAEEIEHLAMSAWIATGEDPHLVAARERQKDFPVREGFWLQRLRPHLAEQTIVFVCGADHIDTFRARLEADGNDVSVYCREWPSSSP